jgi:hypothetical protein
MILYRTHRPTASITSLCVLRHQISSADTLSVSEIGQSIASQVAAIQDGTDVYCQRRDLIMRSAGALDPSVLLSF